MLYWIQAKIQIKVYGISGPFEETITKMVQANSTNEAKAKYEQHVRKMFAHMQGESFNFQYLIIADTI